MNSNSHKNHCEAVYIINSVGIAYHQCGALYIIIAKEDTACGWWYAPSVMKYTLKRDDIPLLSQWIKKFDKSKLVEFFGGGWWIRTTEGIASRFTVCPLWPLGKSPIFTFLSDCLYGAGRRTRTPDLLITNQLLYQLSYTGGSNRTRLL